MLRRHRKHALLLAPVLAAIFYVACGGGGVEDLPPCISSSDCPTGNRCINNVCFPPGLDAGPTFVFDAGPDGFDAGLPAGEDAGPPPPGDDGGGGDAGTPGDDAGTPIDDAGMDFDAATSGT